MVTWKDRHILKNLAEYSHLPCKNVLMFLHEFGSRLCHFTFSNVLV